MDLWPFAESAVTMRASSAGRRRVVLAIERGESGPMFAVLESAKTLQALLDLLLAAEDFVAGRRHAKITVTIERDGDFAVVSLLAYGEDDQTAADGSTLADRPSLHGPRRALRSASCSARLRAPARLRGRTRPRSRG